MSGVLLERFNVRKHTGIQISEDRDRMDFDMEKMDQDVVQAIEREANKVIESHLDIVAKMLTWGEVNQDVDLKLSPRIAMRKSIHPDCSRLWDSISSLMEERTF